MNIVVKQNGCVKKNAGARIEKLYGEMIVPAIPHGCCGCIYTQLSDIEDEINGLYSYDRQVCKVEGDRMRKIGERVKKALKE